MSRMHKILLLVGLLGLTGFSFGLTSSHERSCQASELDAVSFSKSYDSATGGCEDGTSSCRAPFEF